MQYICNSLYRHIYHLGVQLYLELGTPNYQIEINSKKKNFCELQLIRMCRFFILLNNFIALFFSFSKFCIKMFSYTHMNIKHTYQFSFFYMLACKFCSIHKYMRGVVSKNIKGSFKGFR